MTDNTTLILLCCAIATIIVQVFIIFFFKKKLAETDALIDSYRKECNTYNSEHSQLLKEGNLQIDGIKKAIAVLQKKDDVKNLLATCKRIETSINSQYENTKQKIKQQGFETEKNIKQGLVEIQGNLIEKIGELQVGSDIETSIQGIDKNLKEQKKDLINLIEANIEKDNAIVDLSKSTKGMLELLKLQLLSSIMEETRFLKK